MFFLEWRCRFLAPWDSVSSVQLLSSVRLCNPMDCSMPYLSVHHQLRELAQTHVCRVGEAIQPSHPLLSPSPPSFSFSISPSNEYSGLISFGMDWLDLLAIQGALKSLLQHHGSKASICWRSAFFMAQLSHPYMTTGKTVAWTRQIFVGNVSAFYYDV